MADDVVFIIIYENSWWRHQMEAFSALLALCAGNSPVPVNSPHKGQWRGVLMFSLICVWINGWINNRGAGDLIRHRGHYDFNVMLFCSFSVLVNIDIARKDIRYYSSLPAKVLLNHICVFSFLLTLALWKLLKLSFDVYHIMLNNSQYTLDCRCSVVQYNTRLLTTWQI